MSHAIYPAVQLYIDGQWTAGEAGEVLSVFNPATGETIGTLAKAGPADLTRAVQAAVRGFAQWRQVSAFQRSKVLRKSADVLRGRVEDVARIMTTEQGKPLAEARTEILGACDTMDWFAEEARRTYGRLVPPRVSGVAQMVVKEPVGPVAAFSPWNFPINQAVRKISAAIAAGCSILLKGPEDTPASVAALVQALHDAGLPAGVVNLVYGDPTEISAALIPHPAIRKISFTGSTPVGKQLAGLAGAHMKRVTMELGGHAPAIICSDASLDQAVQVLSAAKFRNAGQVCVAPTRFLIQQDVFEPFVERFVAVAEAITVGDGLQDGTKMGPLAHERRLSAMEGLLTDARQKGAQVRTGGERVGNRGNFFAPTVLTNLNHQMRVMNEEPFGPIALMIPFRDLDDALTEANRLEYGLASYAFTHSTTNVARLSEGIEAGMLTINHNGLALPEVPFGGIKDSGYGSEGGLEAIENYLNTKFVSQLG